MATFLPLHKNQKKEQFLAGFKASGYVQGRGNLYPPVGGCEGQTGSQAEPRKTSGFPKKTFRFVQRSEKIPIPVLVLVLPSGSVLPRRRCS